MSQSVLFIEGSASPAAVQRIRELITSELRTLNILTEGSFSGLDASKNENAYDAVVVYDISPSFEQLTTILTVLKPGGQLSIENVADAQAVTLSLTLNGFLNIQPQFENSSTLTASKPSWNTGESAALPTNSGAVRAPWKMSQLVDDDIIDEDELLDDSLPVSAIRGCGPSDGTSKKRACKNCSCGLAEEESKEREEATKKLTAEQLTKKVTGCGNCSKGDAFRCGSCPFNGMPKFEAGQEHVMLKMTSDL